MVRKIKEQISRELYLTIENNHLQRENLQLQIKLSQLQIENLEKDKYLTMLGKRDLQNKIKLLDQQHKRFLENEEIKLGFKILNRTINPDSLNVSD